MVQTGKNIRETLIVDPECSEIVLPLTSPKLHYLREHGLFLSGIRVLRKHYEVRRKTNNSHLVLYTLGGEGWLKTEGYDGILVQGQVWISAEGTVQEYGLHGEEWKFLWFDLQNKPPWTVISGIGTSVRESVQGQSFRQAMDTLMWEFQTDGMYADRVIQLCSEMILAYLEREFALECKSSSYYITNRIHNFFFTTVKSQIQHPWTVKELAEKSELYISPDHFGRLCVRYLKISPMKLVNQLRLERAMELLHGTNYPIQKISTLVGYQNYFAFSTAFKRWSGASPRSFRDKLSK